MTNQRSTQDLDKFLQLLTASGLLEQAAVESALNEFRDTHVDNRPGEDARAFASHLVVRGQLTCWQAEKLRNGRYKGFFIDGYKLRDHVDCDDTRSRYLAEDIRTGRLVVLAVTLAARTPRKDGMPHYRVEDYGD